MFKANQQVINRYGKKSVVISVDGIMVLTTDGMYHHTKLFAA